MINFSVTELVNKIKNREIASTEIAEEYLKNISRLEPKVCGFMEVFENEVKKQAENVDNKIRTARLLAGLQVYLLQ